MRGPGVLALEPPAGLVMAWLFNDVPTGASLRRGSKEARAPVKVFWNQACPPRFSPAPGEEPFMAGVMIGAGPHTGSHTAVAISGAARPRTEVVRATELPVAQRPPIIVAYRKGARSDVDWYFARLPDPGDHPAFRITPASSQPQTREDG